MCEFHEQQWKLYNLGKLKYYSKDEDKENKCYVIKYLDLFKGKITSYKCEEREFEEWQSFKNDNVLFNV